MKRKNFSYNTLNKLKKINRCQECKKRHTIKEKLQKHHIKPLSKGGTNNIKNILLVCKECHKRLDREAMGK